MFDHMSLDELREWRSKLTHARLSHAGLQSFSLPDGVSQARNPEDIEKCLTEINQAIARKLGRGGRFVGIEIRS